MTSVTLRYSVIVQLGLPFEHDHPPVQFYFVRHRRARRYILRVDNDGRVRVTIPRGGSRREATEFGLRHLEWIANQRTRLDPSRVSAPDRALTRARASVELRQRLLQLAGDHGLTVSRISIRDQRSRWGSCGYDGHICLNWRLMLMPPGIRDYVMIHELMHLRRMDHSRRYWELVAAAYPDYQSARAWLRQHGPSLR
jgi:predicted metal-dependent hydrolase